MDGLRRMKERSEEYHMEYTEIQHAVDKYYGCSFPHLRLGGVGTVAVQMDVVTAGETAGIEDYRQDVMHPEHDEIHWRMCVDAHCDTHQTARKAVGGTVFKPSCESDEWEQCEKMACVCHLYSKRVFRCFPGCSELWRKMWERSWEYDIGTKWCNEADLTSGVLRILAYSSEHGG